METLDVLALDSQQTTPLVIFEDERAELEQSGSQVLVITPDETSVVARGPNPLDSSRRAVSAQAGRRRGGLLAESVRRFWQE